MKFELIYKGFLQNIRREFLTYEAAQKWARQVGVLSIAMIKPIE